jgi:prolyl-tRNA editing enzyme YbaK/EbsC (Cys-tRNA(Pro) deacylase)
VSPSERRRASAPAVWRVLGTLTAVPALQRPDLLGEPVVRALGSLDGAELVGVAEIDPRLADTAAFCAAYSSPMGASANCVVVAGRRGPEVRYAACLVLATTLADVNGLVRRRLDARKASFAPMDEAVALTGMEHGGITPLGLPERWPLLVDPAVASAPAVVVGSGVRRSKLALPGSLVAALPGADVLDGLGRLA